MIWKIKRYLDIKKMKKTHCHSMSYKNAKNIKLAMTFKEMKDYGKKCDYNFEDWEYQSILTSVYLKLFKNTIDDIKYEIYKKASRQRKQFKKLFWNEYVHEHDVDFDYKESYKDYNSKVKKYNKIKRLLDKHPDLHGITGKKLQFHNHKLYGMELNFTWRAWGSLMAAYMNSKIKERKYHYMDFYM